MSMKMNWGWRIAIVYSFFAVSTMGFVVFAMSENVELVRKDYYEESLRYDATFASAERGNQIANQVEITAGKSIVTIALPSSHSQIDSATVNFYRAENSKLDRRFSITGHTITVPVKSLQPGTYQADVEWRNGGQWFRISRSISIAH